MRYLLSVIILSGCLFLVHRTHAGKDKEPGLSVDQEKRTVTIPAKIAPRKLEYLKGEVYPIEVIGCWPHPRGKKAHETVITFEVSPLEIHKAVLSLGLKPGKPVMGEGPKPPEGPEVALYLLVPQPDGSQKKLGMDKVLVDSRTGAAFPKSVKFRFTGSAMTQPNPEKEEKVYGADLSGTLAVIFPVTDQTVFQTNLTMKEEKYMKLETNTKTLPPEGTAVKLVIEVPR